MPKHLIARTLAAALAASLVAAGPALADEGADKLPEGPIRDRHELMEEVGKNAKTIGDALKSGDHSPVEAAATEIQQLAGRASALFPEGSLHEDSRAMPVIWERWDDFDGLMNDMGTRAGALAAAAKAGDGVGPAAKAMFDNCKSCHDDFRKPEEKE